MLQKTCELADYLQTREAAESPRKGPVDNIEDAIDKYLESVENVLSDIQTKLVLKVHRGGRASDAELVSPPDTPRTPRTPGSGQSPYAQGFTLNETFGSFGSQGSTPRSTPGSTNSFTALLRPT